MEKSTSLKLLALTCGLGLLENAYGAPTIYKVQSGDIFSSIVQDYSNKNPDIPYNLCLKLFLQENGGKNIKDFNTMFPGDKIIIPDNNSKLNFLTEYPKKHLQRYFAFSKRHRDEEQGMKYYQVRYGDTLAKIAKEFYPGEKFFGNKGSITRILENNPEIVDANLIFEGQKLVISSNKERRAISSENDKGFMKFNFPKRIESQPGRKTDEVTMPIHYAPRERKQKNTLKFNNP